jgi:hypothetical protein
MPAPELKPLRDTDAGERAQLFKAIVLFSPPAFIMLGALWYFLYVKAVIPGWLAGALVLLDAPVAVLAAVGLNAAVGRGSRGFVDTLYATGGPPPPPTYPREEMLIARGQYAEAADYFRDHLRASPEDLEARMRLAALLERQLKDDAGAEQLYLEVRRLATDRHREFAAANGLIDLYRRVGRRDRLRVELARFAERFRGSEAAAAAARELRALKAEETPGAA